MKTKSLPPLVGSPPTERQFSPDVVGEIFAPADYSRGMLMASYGYRILINSGRLGEIDDASFVKPMRRDLDSALRRNVLNDARQAHIPRLRQRHVAWRERMMPRLEPKQWYKVDHRTPWGSSHENEIGWSLLVNPAVMASPQAAFLAMLRHNLAPPYVFCRNSRLMDHNLDPNEANARGLLREIVGEEAYRDYLRSGFVKVVGRTGLTYLVRGGQDTIEVRSASSPAAISEMICIQFKKQMPYTDSLIMRVLLVKNDEMATRAMSNVRELLPPARTA